MRTATIALGAALLAATLTACGSTDTSSKTSSSPTAVTPDQRASIAAAAGIPPEPTAAVRAKYLDDLSTIDPDIVHGKPDTAVDRGRNQCSSIKQGMKQAKLVELTDYRFSSPTHPNGHGTATAAKILDVVHTRLCPDF
jgi:hypothetical protein